MRGDLTSPENFEALVREHQGMVFRTLTRLTGRGGAGGGFGAGGVLAAVSGAAGVSWGCGSETYLYRIVVNVAQDEWKRRRKERGVIATALRARKR